MGATADIHSSRLKSVVKNSTALFFTKIFMPLSFFLITVTLARILGVEEYGIFSVILGYYAVFRIITSFGIDSFLIREVARNEEKAPVFFGNACVVGLCLSVANIVFMNLTVYGMSYPLELRENALLFSLLLLSEPCIRYSEAIFIAFGKSKYVFFTVCISEVFKITAALAALFIFRRLIAVIAVLVLANFLAASLDMFFIRRAFFKPEFRLRREVLTDMLKTSGILALIGGVNSFFLATDIIVLSKIKGEYSAGLYSAAYKFITFAFLFIDSIGMALLPVLSKVYKHSLDEFKALSGNAVQYCVIFGLFFCVITYFLSGPVIVLIYGRDFVFSASILKILVWSSLLLGCSYFYGKLLFVANMQKYDLAVLVIACAANLFLNIFFTSRWGALGTASATLISVTLLFFLHTWFFYTKVVPFKDHVAWHKLIFAGALFFVLALLFTGINLYVGLLAALLFFSIALVKTGSIRKGDLVSLGNAFLSMVNKKNGG